eukprot:3083476-Rhodomonas_salina.1
MFFGVLGGGRRRGEEGEREVGKSLVLAAKSNRKAIRLSTKCTGKAFDLARPCSRIGVGVWAFGSA